MIKSVPPTKEISFFDEFSRTEPLNNLWSSKEEEIEKYVDNRKILISGIFKKKGKNLKAWTSRYFAITENKMLFYKQSEKSSKTKKICPLTTTRLEFLPAGACKSVPQTYMGFRLIKQGKFSEIFTDNEHEYLEWKRILVSCCILLHFHDFYNVDKMIGKGNFARVYMSKHKLTNQPFAIKAFSKDFVINQPKGRENLINEINILRAICHPQIVKLLEVYESPNSVFLVLEMLKGGELFTRLAEKNDYSEHDIKVILKKLLSGLNYLHQKKLMHRDLKPENLLLRDEVHITDLILADFGLATFLDGSEILFKRCGTPGFVAPEILLYTEESKMYNEKCDIYSAGVIFYILLTGRQPFFGEDFNEIMRLNKLGVVDYTLKEFSRYSANALDLVQKMLDFNPNTRISAIDSMNHKFLENVDITNENTQPESPTTSAISIRNNLKKVNKEFSKKLRNKNEDNLGSLDNIVNNKDNPLQTTKIPVYGNPDSHEDLHDDSNSLGALDSPIKRNLKQSRFSKSNQKEEKKEDDDEIDNESFDEDIHHGLMKPMQQEEAQDLRVQMTRTLASHSKHN